MEEKGKIELTKQEFFGLMMLYAANIDGDEKQEELDVILGSIGDEAYQKSRSVFDSLNDIELINYFRDHKARYFKSDMDEKIFFSEIQTVISADHHIDMMEKMLLVAFKKILKE